MKIMFDFMEIELPGDTPYFRVCLYNLLTSRHPSKSDQEIEATMGNIINAISTGNIDLVNSFDEHPVVYPDVKEFPWWGKEIREKVKQDGERHSPITITGLVVPPNWRECYCD